ncbi:MAG: type I pantothenate kinase, partial [Bacteroidales bacterium]|nr:type I pantothenate kinase [Bacteroidales bacterium]
KKGFPESYDIHRLRQFVEEIKSGCPNVKAPIYSHILYDVVPNEQMLISPQTDILIIEGLPVLQNRMTDSQHEIVLSVSDFLDFSIYVDAEENHLFDWFLSRFMSFRHKAINDPSSHFYSFTQINDEEAVEIAQKVWQEINSKNLHEHILPTRERADLILHKGENHCVDYVKVKKRVCPPLLFNS